MKDKTIALRIKNMPIINKMNKIGDSYHGSSYVTCSLSLSLSALFLLINSSIFILHHFHTLILFVSHLVYILLDAVTRWHASSYHCPRGHDGLQVSSSTPGGRSPRTRCTPPSRPRSPPGSSPCCRGPPAPLQRTRLTFTTLVMGTERISLNDSICIKIAGLHCKNKIHFGPTQV